MKTTSVPPVLPRRDFLKTAGLAASGLALAQPAALMAQQASPSLTVAFVGCAHIHTPEFVGVLKSRPEVKVKAVWDHDQARAEKRAGELGSKTVANVKDIWADDSVQAVIVASETDRHRDLVLAGAAARKHMFVEKPLGITAAESYEMADAIEKNKLLFTTGYFMRTQSMNLFLKEQVQAGSLGKITRIRGSNCHSGSLGGWFDKEWRWMADPKQAGVGAFGDLGTHSLDIMMWLLGDVESVTADVRVVTGRYGECDETGEAVLRFKNGVIGTLAAGWVSVDNPIPMEISGTEGHVVIVKNDLFFKSKKVEGADGSDPWRKMPRNQARPLPQFLDAVAGKPGMALVGVREAAARVAVMEAAYKAARTQTWVKPV